MFSTIRLAPSPDGHSAGLSTVPAPSIAALAPAAVVLDFLKCYTAVDIPPAYAPLVYTTPPSLDARAKQIFETLRSLGIPEHVLTEALSAPRHSPEIPPTISQQLTDFNKAYVDLGDDPNDELKFGAEILRDCRSFVEANSFSADLNRNKSGRQNFEVRAMRISKEIPEFRPRSIVSLSRYHARPGEKLLALPANMEVTYRHELMWQLAAQCDSTPQLGITGPYDERDPFSDARFIHFTKLASELEKHADWSFVAALLLHGHRLSPYRTDRSIFRQPAKTFAPVYTGMSPEFLKERGEVARCILQERNKLADKGWIIGQRTIELLMRLAPAQFCGPDLQKIWSEACASLRKPNPLGLSERRESFLIELALEKIHAESGGKPTSLLLAIVEELPGLAQRLDAILTQFPNVLPGQVRLHYLLELHNVTAKSLPRDLLLVLRHAHNHRYAFADSSDYIRVAVELYKETESQLRGDMRVFRAFVRAHERPHNGPVYFSEAEFKTGWRRMASAASTFRTSKPPSLSPELYFKTLTRPFSSGANQVSVPEQITMMQSFVTLIGPFNTIALFLEGREQGANFEQWYRTARLEVLEKFRGKILSPGHFKPFEMDILALNVGIFRPEFRVENAIQHLPQAHLFTYMPHSSQPVAQRAISPTMPQFTHAIGSSEVTVPTPDIVTRLNARIESVINRASIALDTAWEWWDQGELRGVRAGVEQERGRILDALGILELEIRRGLIGKEGSTVDTVFILEKILELKSREDREAIEKFLMPLLLGEVRHLTGRKRDLGIPSSAASLPKRSAHLLKALLEVTLTVEQNIELQLRGDPQAAVRLGRMVPLIRRALGMDRIGQVFEAYQVRESASGPKTNVRIYQSNGYERHLGGFISNTCAKKIGTATKIPDNLRFFAFDSPDVSVNQPLMLGGCYVFDTKDKDGENVFVVRGFNPTEDASKSVDPTALFEVFLDYLEKIGPGFKMKQILAPQDVAEIMLSNEWRVIQHFAHKYLLGQKPRLKKLANNKDVQFNDIRVPGDFVVLRDIP